MIQKTKAWLRLFRAHTAILETPIAVAGAALGLGTIWDIQILGWVLFGVLYHFAGYGMNSYTDWVKGFDKDDPHKKHHPLNTEDLTPKEAKYGVIIALVTLILVGEVMAGFSMVAHVSIVVMLAAGTTYNLFGKITDLKFLPISLVHTMVFVFPFVVYTDNLTYAAGLITAGFFIHHVFQIVISGDVKDLKQDEASLLQRLGTRVEDVPLRGGMFSAGVKVQTIGYALSIAQISVAVAAYFLQDGISIGMAIIGITGAWMLYETDKVIGDGPYMREMRVKAMSKKELAGIWMLCASVIPVITIQGWLAIVGLSLAYFFPVSKFIWGNWLKPEV